MEFKMRQEKVHEIEQNFQTKVERLTVFPIWKKKNKCTKMKQEKVHQH